MNFSLKNCALCHDLSMKCATSLTASIHKSGQGWDLEPVKHRNTLPKKHTWAWVCVAIEDLWRVTRRTPRSLLANPFSPLYSSSTFWNWTDTPLRPLFAATVTCDKKLEVISSFIHLAKRRKTLVNRLIDKWNRCSLSIQAWTSTNVIIWLGK